MRKMKKIITLAMTLVMMMAMSITAFAASEDQVPKSSVTVENLQAGDVATIYKVAHVVEADNTVVAETWTNGKYVIGHAADGTATALEVQMTAKQVNELKSEATKQGTTATGTDKTVAEGATSVTFDGLDAGVYLVLVKSSKATYSPMVSVALERKSNGSYGVKDDTVTAKGTGNDLNKTAEDQLVSVGKTVKFTIEKTIPSFVDKFVVYDYTYGLSTPSKATVTIEDTNYSKEFDFVADGTVERVLHEATETTAEEKADFNKYAIDFTELVLDKDGKFVNTYAGKKLTIVYTANVLTQDGYINDAEYKTNDNEESNPVRVIGVEADITLIKVGEKVDGVPKRLNGAVFTLTKKGKEATETEAAVADEVLTFTKNNDGEYVFDPTKKGNAEATKLTTIKVGNEDGIIKVVGLEEGTYVFEEIEAPTGYSIKTNIAPVSLSETVLHQELTVEDSTLIQLPFTGGMGTTIFTVLGVAIMAIAAALFFATKKSRN